MIGITEADELKDQYISSTNDSVSKSLVARREKIKGNISLKWASFACNSLRKKGDVFFF